MDAPNLPHSIEDAAKVAQFEGALTAKFGRWLKENNAYFQLDDQCYDEEQEAARERIKEWLLHTYAHAYALGYNEAIGNIGRTCTKAYNDADIKF